MPGRPRSWTDDDLIRAVEQSTTLVEVLARLGLSVGGASLGTVRRRMLELGLDEPTLLRMATSDKWVADPTDAVAHAPVHGTWSEDELRMAVATSTSMREVLERLGYRGSGAAWTTAKAQIVALRLDTSHFGAVRFTAPIKTPAQVIRRTWTDGRLAEAVATSKSVAGVLRQLGLKPGGSMYVNVSRRIEELGLDTSHFTGRGWSRGHTITTWKGRPLEEILVAGSDYQSTGSLRRRLIKEGLLDARCCICGMTDWQGAAMPLQLDHINGDRRDNRLENLRILCPNCHAQTDTWCGKNLGRYAPQGSLVEGQTRTTQTGVPRGVRVRIPRDPPQQLTFGELDALD